MVHHSFKQQVTAGLPVKEHEAFSGFSVWMVVIRASRARLNFSFHHLSSPDGWSCQPAQTIHHLKATLSNISALPPLLHQQHLSPSHSPGLYFFYHLSPLLTCLSCLLGSIFPLLLFSCLYSPTLGSWSLFSPSVWSTVHHHSCMLSPLTHLLLTCLYV